MNITVVGTGYVGLVTGACLAEIGHQVLCIDTDRRKIESLEAGRIPIYEPGLEQIVQRCSAMSGESQAAGSIGFSTDLQQGVLFGDVIFIAVGTPSLPSGDPDLQYVEAVARGIGQYMVQTDTTSRYRVIVNKSTVPIGSGDWVRMVILEGSAQAASEHTSFVGHSRKTGTGTTVIDPQPDPVIPQFDVVSNPEFLREGTAIWDTFNPDRIVIGSDSLRAIEVMRRLYGPIITRSFAAEKRPEPVPFVVTDLTSAEMIKYAANAFLATKISFINEIANICERVGANVTQVATGIGLDSRIGPKFLNAGIGWGGSCFLKDVSALIRTAADYNYDTRLLSATVEVNRQQRMRVIEKLQQELKVLKGKTIGLLGLTFKPDTDDLRDAPSLTLIENLVKLGARVKGYDPILSGAPVRHPGLAGINLEPTIQKLAQDCDALILVTEWQEFQTTHFAHLAEVMRRPLMVDARNFLNPEQMAQAGFYYVGVGQ